MSEEYKRYAARVGETTIHIFVSNTAKPGKFKPCEIDGQPGQYSWDYVIDFIGLGIRGSIMSNNPDELLIIEEKADLKTYEYDTTGPFGIIKEIK